MRNADRLVNDVFIDIQDQEDNYFIDHLELMDLINDTHTEYVMSSTLSGLDLKVLENRIEQHAFIKDAQLYYDIKGNLQVDVKQAKPIARIYSSTGEDQYIDFDGAVLPVNAKHTARVPLLEVSDNWTWSQTLLEDETGQQLLALLKIIEGDEFWRAQIAHLFLNKKAEIEMIPQVTKQRIVFGAMEEEELAHKFKKLKTFYTEILPNKGWNTYSIVNLKFKDQIVCE